ncbi:MAG: hypothetical protein AB8G05_20145 [Oligoflexales bacterium]
MKTSFLVVVFIAGLLTRSISFAEWNFSEAPPKSFNRSLMNQFYKESEEIFLASHHENKSQLLDEFEFDFLNRHLPQTSHSQYKPYHKLAHYMFELVIWDQLKSQIKDLVWQQVKGSLKKYSSQQKNEVIKVISNRTAKDIGLDVLAEIKSQIDLPIWTYSKLKVLELFWDEHFRNTSNHIYQVFSKVNFTKAFHNGSLDSTIDNCIHFAFIQFQMTAIVNVDSQEHYIMEDILAAFFREQLHKTDESINEVLKDVVFPRIPSNAVRHQIELLCS